LPAAFSIDQGVRSVQTREAAALGSLAGKAMAGTASRIEEMHQAVFSRSAFVGGPPVRLNDADVYRQIHAWLERDKVGQGPPPSLDPGAGAATDAAVPE
jgi:hypothetical protein